jgi:hypothetical protein
MSKLKLKIDRDVDWVVVSAEVQAFWCEASFEYRYRKTAGQRTQKLGNEVIDLEPTEFSELPKETLKLVELEPKESSELPEETTTPD